MKITGDMAFAIVLCTLIASITFSCTKSTELDAKLAIEATKNKCNVTITHSKTAIDCGVKDERKN